MSSGFWALAPRELKRTVDGPAGIQPMSTLPVRSKLRSQNATLRTGRGGHRKYLPFAFTEHGALMAANVLTSSRVVAMSVYVNLCAWARDANATSSGSRQAGGLPHA